ncbi:MAG TPA: VOC family protein [Kineosporiaceae bacterium]|nr:VOC family protein [Kineosporiaceae bacterium]
MLRDSKAFSGYSVDDLEAAHEFYAGVLGLDVEQAADMPIMRVRFGGDRHVVVYAKPDHQPATFTVLNFPVDDIDAAVDQLAARGVTFERYDGFGQDDKGVMRGRGPLIAWFKDPAGNVLSVVEEPQG